MLHSMFLTLINEAFFLKLRANNKYTVPNESSRIMGVFFVYDGMCMYAEFYREIRVLYVIHNFSSWIVILS